MRTRCNSLDSRGAGRGNVLPYLNQASLGPGLGAETPELRSGSKAITLRHGVVPSDDGQGKTQRHHKVDAEISVEG